MYLVVGLGNPGESYKFNRHNAGFLLTEKICEHYELTAVADKFKSKIFKGNIAEEKVMVIKPQTYMNASGKSVSSFVNYYKIDLANVIVAYDDLDLAFGKVKITRGGSDAGHNGIKSINHFIKNTYLKLKIGIGHPGNPEKVSSYVLNDFSVDEQDKLNKLAQKIAQNFEILIQGYRDKFLNKLALDRQEDGI